MSNRLIACLVATAAACCAADSIAAEDAPTSTLPYTPSLDVSAMDRAANPCDDLYQYSCGGWMKNNPIPADQSSWSVYRKAYVDNQRYLWGLLQEDARTDTERNATQQLIGDFFAACMDTGAIEKEGLAPANADLALIERLDTKHDLGALLGDLQARTGTAAFFFGVGSEQDAKESTRVIGAFYPGGLGLPDRDYYVTSDARSKEIRTRYVEHVATMFKLLGDSPEQARLGAATVMRIETALAKASLTRVERRDPYKVYHRTTEPELRALAPAIDWKAYEAAAGLTPHPWVNVADPGQMKEVQAVVEREPLPALKTYLRWALVNTRAAELPKAFRDADFDFYQHYLNGVPEQPPRWKTCVAQVDELLGEALGREFVERNFPPEARAAAVKMTLQIQDAMRVRIEQLDWMSPETKKQAIDKLTKMRNKVGYPDKWRDYSAVQVSRDDYYGNVQRATLFETRRQMAKIGRPLDRDEWMMTPATVNAYYNPSMNDINFPAGVLMPPLYDTRMDDAPNYGNTGGTIGHELTHGFDDEGRNFDGDGNLRDWWTKDDAKGFESRAQCVRDQYADYVVVDDVHINSKLTAGEDIADLGGLIIAWMAWQEQTKGAKLESQDGMTPEQRFFVGFAQWACGNYRPENLRVRAITDPHSPAKYRINGVVENMPEFLQAFSCKKGDGLYKPENKRCKVW
jgi:endothelin-converting enzyme/putative endopeptidase